MKKIYLVVFAAFCCGCSNMKTPADGRSTIPPGAEILLNNSYRLIEAYQQNDADAWDNMVCRAKIHGSVLSLSSFKFLGRFDDPRLISISSISASGNFPSEFRAPKVSIEVRAENYSVGKFVLTFIEDKDEGCIGVLF